MSTTTTAMPLAKRMLQGAKNYAASDRSDPFAFARALAHIENGICGILQDGSDAFYSADQTSVQMATATGEEYTAIAWKNLRRP